MISRRHLLFCLPALSILAPSALVSSAEAAGAKKEQADPSVRLASVGIPVMRGNQVVNYLFLTIRINLTPKASVMKMREMEPVFRDTLVRVAHRISFAKPDRDDQLDEARFKSVMMQEFGKVAGPGAIASIDILVQSPKKHRS